MKEIQTLHTHTHSHLDFNDHNTKIQHHFNFHSMVILIPQDPWNWKFKRALRLQLLIYLFIGKTPETLKENLPTFNGNRCLTLDWNLWTGLVGRWSMDSFINNISEKGIHQNLANLLDIEHKKHQGWRNILDENWKTQGQYC